MLWPSATPARFTTLGGCCTSGPPGGGRQACNSRIATPSGRRIRAPPLPGAAAIVVGARRYERRLDEAPPGTGCPGRGAPEGRVAMYAWVDHYRPLRAALGQVADHLRHEGWRAQVLVDDNALVDRAAAVRAGLGWYGKNTNVLLPGSGILVCPRFGGHGRSADAGAPPPTPVPDGCGPCERCLSACPTGALVGAGTVGCQAVPRLVAAGAGCVPGRVPGGARRPPLRLRRLPDGLPCQPARHSSTPA